MTTPNRRVLYTGVTSDLKRRVWEHRNKYYPKSFTSRYNCVMLVYYNRFDTIADAIIEEKRIKGNSRAYKDSLVTANNSAWIDLWEDVQNWQLIYLRDCFVTSFLAMTRSIVVPLVAVFQ